MASVLGQFLRRSGTLVRTSCTTQARVASGLLHIQQHSSSSSSSSSMVEESTTPPESGRMSKSMLAYQQRAEAHDKFMVEQVAEYEIGRRHLANMMGEDPETFTQEDINAAIQYLLPSGLFEPSARPSMKHPSEVFIKKKAAEFDASGRPFHTFFYTGYPAFYEALHELGKTMISLEQFANKMARLKVESETSQAFNPGGTEWRSKGELSKMFLEELHNKHYVFFIQSMNRLLEHPYSSRAEDFIMRFRKVVLSRQSKEEIPKLLYTAEGVPYMTGSGKRKHAEATVTVYGRGSGKIEINEQDIRFFELIQDREQVVFPLQFTNLLGKVDLVANVTGAGLSSSAGAIRLATSLALQSFVDEHMREKMRLAGLLSKDFRIKERKKPGQKGARAKFTWKKR
ncbi:28S ribosomal protein S9, mitochondrial-like [Portunus trituberculatus]|nr:28S ribosomal protein S9, mitochondrial-like [Portunus trituberculatus]